ncbi:MAG TPA: hypothetical protein VD886_23110 [Herpetosiphonaceae bacterium]|nr:hypothetical protein [Herpetosiphonaceae bacterium]
MPRENQPEDGIKPTGRGTSESISPTGRGTSEQIGSLVYNPSERTPRDVSRSGETLRKLIKDADGSDDDSTDGRGTSE